MNKNESKYFKSAEKMHNALITLLDIKKKHGKTKKKKYRHVYTGSEKVRIFFGVLVANVTLC